MRVSIIGGTLIGNRGAEAMVSVATRQVRSKCPDAAVTLFSYFPEDDRRVPLQTPIDIASGTPAYLLFFIFPLAILFFFAVRLMKCKEAASWFPETIRHWAESRVMLDVSGVSFMDVRLKILPYDVLVVSICMLLGTPLVKLAQAMGPFKHPVNRLFARLFLPGVARIFARGQDTYDSLAALHLATPVNVSTDIALLHTPGTSLTTENEDYVAGLQEQMKAWRNQDNIIVGICPSSVVMKMGRKRGFDYLGYLSMLTAHLLDDGYRVLLFPNATKDHDMTKTRNNDLNPILRMVHDLNTRRGISGLQGLIYVDRNINTDGIKRLLDYVNITVVSRFHAMIACLAMSVPVIVLGWSHKYLEVMRDFGADELVFDYTTGDVDRLRKAVNRCVETETTWRQTLAGPRPVLQERAQEQFTMVATQFLQPEGGS